MVVLHHHEVVLLTHILPVGISYYQTKMLLWIQEQDGDHLQFVCDAPLQLLGEAIESDTQNMMYVVKNVVIKVTQIAIDPSELGTSARMPGRVSRLD
jgi:hypothetical protein